MVKNPYIGTASWNLPKEHHNKFDLEGSHLYRYAKVFNSVEINSSFYKDHQSKTYERWKNSVPEHFRFSVKLSKVFTHEQKLQITFESLKENISSIFHLKEKLSCILIQIPPKLSFNEEIAFRFFENFRKVYDGHLVFEPRHETWDGKNATEILRIFRVSQVIADPVKVYRLNSLDFSGVRYYRLHGSPEVYKSSYDSNRLKEYLKDSLTHQGPVWFIFDNTTFGHATANALELQQLIQENNIASMQI